MNVGKMNPIFYPRLKIFFYNRNNSKFRWKIVYFMPSTFFSSTFYSTWHWPLNKNVCFPLLFLRLEMFPSQRRYHLTAFCPRDTYGSHLGLTWLWPKNIIYYCPRCSKSFASVGSVKNLLSCEGTHLKGLVCHIPPLRRNVVRIFPH